MLLVISLRNFEMSNGLPMVFPLVVCLIVQQ